MGHVIIHIKYKITKLYYLPRSELKCMITNQMQHTIHDRNVH